MSRPRRRPVESGLAGTSRVRSERGAVRPIDPSRAAAAIPTSGGLYALAIDLSRPSRLHVGRLPPREYAAGTYVYTGSARAGLRARLARHLGATRLRHWHVDWVLEMGTPRAVWWLVGAARLECAIAARLRALGAAVTGFGASDCHCGSHLIALGPVTPCQAFAELTAAFRDAGRPGSLTLVVGARRRRRDGTPVN